MNTASSAAPAVRTTSLIKVGAIAGVVAAAANLVVFLVAKAAGASMQVTMGSRTTSIVFLQPLLASFIAVFAGSLVLLLMLRLRSGAAIWTGLAVVFVVAYTGYAFQAASTSSTGLILTLMHVVALGVAFGLLLPAARARTAN